MVLAGAVIFGLYIGYLAFANDSFPSQTRPFGDYAQVTSTVFNGTEFAVTLNWQNSSALPLYTQLTSSSTDAANTPVCNVGLTTVSKGQSIFMPFAITPTSASVSNADLSIAVKSLSTGSEFTIVYSFPPVSASNVVITPSDISCSQGPSIE